MVLCALLLVTSAATNPTHQFENRLSKSFLATQAQKDVMTGKTQVQLSSINSRGHFPDERHLNLYEPRSVQQVKVKRHPVNTPTNLRSSNIFIRNSWEVLPLQAKLANARREATTRTRDHLNSIYPNFHMGSINENSSTKRSPEPSSSDTSGLTLSIMSPLDVLREKMLLSMANRRIHMKNKISHDNDAFLRKYG